MVIYSLYEGYEIEFTLMAVDEAGLTQEQIDTITSQSEGNAAAFRNVGMRNVSERIRLYYKEQGNFRITSEPGKYTMAEIVLPQIEQEGEFNAYPGSVSG